MIFPPFFPKKESYSHAEGKIFNSLSQLNDEDFTIFYNQEFSSINPREANEYEIDFIIADHRNNQLNTIIVVEANLESQTNRVRVRTIGDVTIPKGILVECLKSIRDQYPTGTRFYAQEMKVCKKPDGRIYLRAKDQMIYTM